MNVSRTEGWLVVRQLSHDVMPVLLVIILLVSVCVCRRSPPADPPSVPGPQVKNNKVNESPLPRYKRDLVQKLKILRQELQAMQPQSGHCRIEVSREEIFEVTSTVSTVCSILVVPLVPFCRGEAGLVVTQRCMATFVTCFHWSLLLAFSLHFSSSSAFLRSLFTQSSHLRS